MLYYRHEVKKASDSDTENNSALAIREVNMEADRIC